VYPKIPVAIHAMTAPIRVPLVTPGTRPELSAIERSIAEQRGSISVLYQVLLNSAPLASGWEKLLTAVRNQTSVPADLRELVILRVAVLNRATFEFEAHVPHARRAGLTETKIASVRDWHGGSHRVEAEGRAAETTFDADEELVLELADGMTRDVEVPDELMQRLRTRFDARGVLEVVATVAAYNMVSRLLVALRIEH
jgi:4-carboxymuconolactone decarboxylase